MVCQHYIINILNKKTIIELIIWLKITILELYALQKEVARLKQLLKKQPNANNTNASKNIRVTVWFWY